MTIFSAVIGAHDFLVRPAAFCLGLLSRLHRGFRIDLFDGLRQGPISLYLGSHQLPAIQTLPSACARVSRATMLSYATWCFNLPGVALLSLHAKYLQLEVYAIR